MPLPSNPDYLEKRPVGRLLLEFSAPSIVAAFVSATYNFVARIFVGQSIGAVGLAALGVSFPFMLLSLAFAMMIGTGASTLISIRLGERRNDKAEEVLGQAIFLYFVLSALFLVFGLLYLEPMLRLFGATDSILPYAKSYLSIIIWGTIFSNFSFGVNNFIRSEGKPRIAMTTMIISGILNLVLDWLFLFVFKTGIWGAAVANVLALATTSLWVVWLYLSGKTVLRWRLKYFRPNWPLMKLIAAFGMVPLVTQACSALIMGVLNHLLGFYGAIYGVNEGLTATAGSDLAIAVMATIFPITMLVLMPILGLSQGMQPIVGYNVGANRPERVHRTLRLSIRAALALCFGCWLVMMIFPAMFLLPFVRPDEAAYAEILSLGARALRLSMFFLPFVGVNVIAGGYFQAHGRPILSLMLTLLRQMIFLLPALVLLPWLFCRFALFDGLDGVFFSFSAADFLAFGVAFVFLWREYRIKRRAVCKATER